MKTRQHGFAIGAVGAGPSRVDMHGIGIVGQHSERCRVRLWNFPPRRHGDFASDKFFQILEGEPDTHVPPVWSDRHYTAATPPVKEKEFVFCFWGSQMRRLVYK